MLAPRSVARVFVDRWLRSLGAMSEFAEIYGSRCPKPASAGERHHNIGAICHEISGARGA